jgi:hypothetical protein
MNHAIRIEALLAVLMTIACLLSNPAHAQLAYSAEAINGKIVDEDTGAPLDGVVIVAKWTIYTMIVGRNNDMLNVLETVSDKDGNYGFPAWGPKMLPVTSIPFSLSELFMEGNDPCLVYFKSGYWPALEKNLVTYSPPLEGTETRKTPWGGFKANGKTIKLKKWDGKDEAKYYERVSDRVDELRGGWKKYPRMTLAIDEIFQMLYAKKKRKEIQLSFPIPHIVSIEILTSEEQAYLKGFAK